jgi:hypothetical protein
MMQQANKNPANSRHTIFPGQQFSIQAATMAPLPKHLSGDQAAIIEFIDKFDVR